MNHPMYPPLRATELIEWIALRRVCGGGVARLRARWFDLGRAVPCYLPDTLDDLHHGRWSRSPTSTGRRCAGPC